MAACCSYICGNTISPRPCARFCRASLNTSLTWSCEFFSTVLIIESIPWNSFSVRISACGSKPAANFFAPLVCRAHPGGVCLLAQLPIKSKPTCCIYLPQNTWLPSWSSNCAIPNESIFEAGLLTHSIFISPCSS